MTKSGRKKRPKRSRPVHGRHAKKRLQQEVKSLYGQQSSQAADEDDRDWQAFEEAPAPRPSASKAASTSSVAASSQPDVPEASRDPADAAPTPPAASDEPRISGQVVGVASGLCWVDDGSTRHQAVLPSRLARLQRSELAVGDQVILAPADDDGTWRVDSVLERHTRLSRPDPHNPRQERLIAANIDDVVIVASVVAPPLRLALIDRYLITVDRGGAKPHIVLNKIDLLKSSQDRSAALRLLQPYRQMGLNILSCSIQTGEGIPELRQALTGRVAVVVGHSGVGKSSLVNALDPTYKLRTGAVGDAGSGRHTTTRSGLYRLEGDIRLIDTPGIRELALGNLDPLELQHYFPELAQLAPGCRFNNCTHLHEPRCAVRQALAERVIEAHRYATYSRLMVSLREDALEPGS